MNHTLTPAAVAGLFIFAWAAAVPAASTDPCLLNVQMCAGDCEVNLGYCEGKCFVNAGYCRGCGGCETQEFCLNANAHCDCDYNVGGYCDGQCSTNVGGVCSRNCWLALGVCGWPSGDICGHASPHAHTYGAGSAAAVHSRSAETSKPFPGRVVVRDDNVLDCKHDRAYPDSDGDFESGAGGAFFGYGPWANELTCDYGLATHGATVSVNDAVFGSDIWILIGADDTAGPVVDPVLGCITDGTITPGDPSTDPGADADDCLVGPLRGSGTACGGGGDGGYWVFLVDAFASEDTSGILLGNVPTVGTIQA